MRAMERKRNRKGIAPPPYEPPFDCHQENIEQLGRKKIKKEMKRETIQLSKKEMIRLLEETDGTQLRKLQE